MNNSMSFAEKELRLLSETHEDPENRPLVEEFAMEIIALCKKFGNSGQSGGSAPYVAGAISHAIGKLLLFQPIAPLTGEDDEWTDCGITDNDLFQNKRCGSVFKVKDDGRAYYLDAIVFEGQSGSRFTSGGVMLKDGGSVSSRQFIKSFPFTPKTFVVEVVETEWADKEETVEMPGGGWWTSVVKNEEQLDSALKYYG